MREKTKNILAGIVIIIVFIICFFAVFAVAPERDYERECSDCSATYSWCPGYWAERQLCNNIKEDAHHE